MEYYTHNAALNISGRRTVYVGLSQNKPQLLWRMVMKEHVLQCSCECGFCVPNLSSIDIAVSNIMLLRCLFMQ